MVGLVLAHETEVLGVDEIHQLVLVLYQGWGERQVPGGYH